MLREHRGAEPTGSAAGAPSTGWADDIMKMEMEMDSGHDMYSVLCGPHSA